MRIAKWCAFVVVVLGSCAFPSGASAQSRSSASPSKDPPFGVGGYSDLPGGSIVQMYAGRVYVSSATVVNTGKIPVDVDLGSSLPTGVSVEPYIPVPFRLDKGESRRVPFRLIASESVVVGFYSASIRLQPTVKTETSGVRVLPAFGVSFNIRILGGEPTNVTVEAINADNGQPTRGTLSVVYLQEGGEEVPIAKKVGTSLVVGLGPGTYKAGFEVEGLIQKFQNFTVVDGETDKRVSIIIRGITFVTTRATKPDDGSQPSRIVFAINNNLKRFTGPISFDVTVRHDGKVKEKYRLATLAELPEGLTEQQSSYSPTDGFSPGKWTFTFSLSTPTYTVTAPAPTSFTMPPGFPWTLVLVVVLSTLGIGVGVMMVVSRRPGLWRRFER